MASQLFISYAWTSDDHRSWVRLLASNLRAVGYDIMIDENVTYGDSLNGFMRQIQDADRVLMIVDQNYVDRADNDPTSGVGYENQWIQAAFEEKPSNWLTAIFINNPTCALPNWLEEHKPKGFDFRSGEERDGFPGSTQIQELWRWIEGLPTDKSHAITAAELRQRAARLERIDRQRDPSAWANPQLSGSVQFNYSNAPGKSFTLGAGDHSFVLQVSSCGPDSVYVYRYPIHSVGLVPSEELKQAPLDECLTAGDAIELHVGQRAILMNHAGNLCLVELKSVQEEINNTSYVPPQIRFTYHILDSTSQLPLTS